MSRIVVIASHAESLINFRGHLLSDMARKGHEVIACAPGLHPKITEKLHRRGVSYRPLALERTGMNPARDFLFLLNLTRMLRRLRPDAVLGYTVKPVIYGSLAARLAGVPGIYVMITGLGYAFMGQRPKDRLLNQVIQRLYRLALKGVRTVFFQNPDDARLFLDKRLVEDARKVMLVNGSGVDLTYFSESPLPNKPVFLLIARLLRDKGVAEYAEAAMLLKRRYPQAEFLLAGWRDRHPNAVTNEELERWTGSGALRYLGALEDVRPAITSSSVYVLPSYREGTPRTVLEAMAMGRPVITTDAPGCRETVIPGENGFLVPVREVESLAEAMERFILDPAMAPRMGRRSREIAEEKYDVHKVNRVIMESMSLA